MKPLDLPHLAAELVSSRGMLEVLTLGDEVSVYFGQRLALHIGARARWDARWTWDGRHLAFGRWGVA